MASITNRGSKWRAQIRKNGHTLNETFNTKAAAQEWAFRTEAALTGAPIVQVAPAGLPASEVYCPANFREILEKYRDKVTVTKKTAYNETGMITQILKADWVDIPLLHITVENLTDYRDSRLQFNTPATVRRYFDVIRHAALTAQDIWEWVSIVPKLAKVKTTVRQVKAVRRITATDQFALLEAAEKSRAKHILPAITLALETGLRRSELARLDWCNVNIDEGWLLVIDTKNGHDREVLLTPTARRVLTALQPDRGGAYGSVLHTTNEGITNAWKRVKHRAGVNVRFHDLRHEAISGWFELGFTPVEVASMSGHRTLSQLMRYSHAARDKMLARMNEVLS